ncbi:hypothetical protein [Photobacterium leiognathi]|uniref:hypothetical protein n=1 Tax=Photobacterium leiognathi TaxID=553611 RepID=UPI0029827640|nr:hypothetical protein [Photobacterium leiognathi]
MPKFEKEDGIYRTGGLSEKQFQQVFKIIQKEQAKARRGAKRTLTPEQLRRKSKAAIAQLGEKSKGVPFTVEDLKQFAANRENFKKRYDSKTDGITYAQIIDGSRDIDIKRANNKVDDGSGITSANLSGMRNNEILIRVRASMKSKHDDHLVKLRLEEWNDLLHEPPGGSYEKAVKKACKGRISIACDCGRHQYWYRYLATMGRYAVSPPTEFAFPKIRNPELKGVACKHVLKAAVMLQSPAWQRIIANQMAKQAKRVSFGDDRMNSHVLTDAELKQAAKNRSTLIDKSKTEKAAKRDFKRYEKAQKAFAKKVKQDEAFTKKIRAMANRSRKAEQRAIKLESQLQSKKDLVKAMYSMMKDVYSMQGKKASDVVDDMASKFKVTTAKIKAMLK